MRQWPGRTSTRFSSTWSSLGETLPDVRGEGCEGSVLPPMPDRPAPGARDRTGSGRLPRSGARGAPARIQARSAPPRAAALVHYTAPMIPWWYEPLSRLRMATSLWRCGCGERFAKGERPDPGARPPASSRQGGSTKICGVKRRWQPRSGARFAGSMTRNYAGSPDRTTLQPHSFWYFTIMAATSTEVGDRRWQ